jgi:hypothetical protein
MKKQVKKPVEKKQKVVEAYDCEKNRTVTINLNEWCTPKQLAQTFGVKKQVVNNWQHRGKLRVMRIEELGLTLVQVKRGANLMK